MKITEIESFLNIIFNEQGMPKINPKLTRVAVISIVDKIWKDGYDGLDSKSQRICEAIYPYGFSKEDRDGIGILLSQLFL